MTKLIQQPLWMMVSFLILSGNSVFSQIPSFQAIDNQPPGFWDYTLSGKISETDLGNYVLLGKSKQISLGPRQNMAMLDPNGTQISVPDFVGGGGYGNPKLYRLHDYLDLRRIFSNSYLNSIGNSHFETGLIAGAANYLIPSLPPNWPNTASSFYPYLGMTGSNMNNGSSKEIYIKNFPVHSFVKNVEFIGNNKLILFIEGPTNVIATLNPGTLDFDSTCWAKTSCIENIRITPGATILGWHNNFVESWDSLGNFLWGKSIGISTINDVFVSEDGSILVGGIDSVLGIPKGVLIKLNPTGTLIWSKHYTDSSSSGTIIKRVVQNKYGTIFCELDHFINMTLDSMGAPLKTQNLAPFFKSINQPQQTDIYATSDGGFLIYGSPDPVQAGRMIFKTDSLGSMCTGSLKNLGSSKIFHSNPGVNVTPFSGCNSNGTTLVIEHRTRVPAYNNLQFNFLKRDSLCDCNYKGLLNSYTIYSGPELGDTVFCDPNNNSTTLGIISLIEPVDSFYSITNGVKGNIGDPVFFSNNLNNQFVIRIFKEGCKYESIHNTYDLRGMAPKIEADTSFCNLDSLIITGSGPNHSWTNLGMTDTLVAYPGNEYILNIDSLGCHKADTFSFKKLILLGDTSVCKNSPFSFLPGQIANGIQWVDSTLQFPIKIDSSKQLKGFVKTRSCNVYDSVRINSISFTQNPLGPDSSLCEGDSLDLDLSFVSGGVVWDDSSSSPIRSFHKGGIYFVSGYDSSCFFTDTIQVSFSYLNDSILGPDTFLCHKPFLITQGVLNPTWMDTIQSDTFYLSAPGIYWVNYSDSFGCQTNDSIAIRPPGPLQPSIHQIGKNKLCSGDSVSLFVNGNYHSVFWSNGDSSLFITLDSSQTATVKVTDQFGCVGTDSIAVKFINAPVPRPNISAWDSASFCPGDSIIVDPGNGYSSYQWNTGSTSRFQSVKSSGLLWVTVENGFGCSGTSQPISLFKTNVSPCSVFISGDTLFSQSSDGKTYNWYINGIQIPGTTRNWVIPNASGTYELNVIDSSGCLCSTTYQYVKTGTMDVLGEGRVTLSPNPFESSFRLRSDFPIHKVSVFNSLGEMIISREFQNLTEVELDLSNSASDLYFIRVETNEGLFLLKGLKK